MALSVHSYEHQGKGGPHPHDKFALRPAAIYTRKFKVHGENALRDHVIKAATRERESVA